MTLEFDFTNLTDAVLGEGRGLVATGSSDRNASALAALRSLAARSPASFLRMPELDLGPILARAAADRGRFDDLVVLGIGGSALGAKAVDRALVRALSGRRRDGRTRDGLRLHFVENVDPTDIIDLLDALDLDRTAFNVISKSGGTVETMTAFFIARDRLRARFDDGYRERVVVTTDPERGSLRPLAAAEGLPVFDVPPGVGGRFSVFTPVGLYPLAAAGHDVAAFLAGAGVARDASLGRSIDDNPALAFAAAHVALYEQGVHDLVLMPYATALKHVAEWFVQLWAESLGKVRPDGSRVGPTPIVAVGATDQHAQLQLFMEGTPNKSVVFVDPGADPHDLVVPAAPDSCAGLAHLVGRTVGEIRAAELAGVRAALTEVGRPTATFRLDGVNARSVGALMMTLCGATALAGTMLGVDPFDQPGVELAKKFAHGVLGRSAEADYAARLEAQLGDVEPRAAFVR